MRDRLIELIQNAVGGCAKYWAKTIADHLLRNGVVVPPYKVGTKVYVITSKTSNNKNFYMFEDIISRYVIGDCFTIMCFVDHMGVGDCDWDKVFLTREDAERALEEKEPHSPSVSRADSSLSEGALYEESEVEMLTNLKDRM